MQQITSSVSAYDTIITGQKRAVRYVAKVDSRSSSSPLFKKFNILKFSDLHKLLILTRIHGSVLDWFKSYLSSRSFRLKCDDDLSPL